MAEFKKIPYYSLRAEALVGTLPTLVGRAEEQERLTRVINRRINNNALIVGPSGIGKSSLAGLLAGMLSPVRGEVLLDGLPVAGLGRSWRILIPQEAYVFAGTLKETLTYPHSATKTELDEAAEAVGLTPFVTRLGGYGAAITPAALSAGERQLIALTRAYLSPARVVILDEATCHLDPAAEEQAETAFSRRGGTLIVIAHRISSARRARRILVLDGARPQVGDHPSLLASSVMYADLAGQWDTPHHPGRTTGISTFRACD